MIQAQTSYCVVAGSPIVPIFSPLFSCFQEKSSWEQAEDFYEPVHCEVAGPHRWTRVWFLGLITLVSSGQGAPSFTALSGRVQVGAGQTPSGVCGNGKLSLIFSLFCPTSPVLQSSLSWKRLVCVFFCHWYLCDVVLSVQLLLQVSVDIVGMAHHWSLEIQTAHISCDASLGYLVGLLKTKERTGACIFPSSVVAI